MAKQPTLIVKVEDSQFQQFMKDFKTFSDRVASLSGQFKQLNNTIKQTSLATQVLQASFNAIHNTTKSILSTVGGITKHFIRWSTIIGSVTALLGMGGGLFGIERLASSIMQRRRQMLGLGGDWGRTRASNIYSQTLMGDPGSVLQNIRMGTAGSQEQMTPLLSLGIPFGTQKKPEDILTEILPKVHQILKSAGPSLALSVAQGYGLDKIFTDPMDLIRLSTEEGYKEIKQREERIKKEAEALKLTKEAQDGWSEFHLQLLKAGGTIESIFGEKLKALAPALSELSRGFVAIVQKIMDMPVVGQTIKDLAKWMTELAEGLTEEKLKDKFAKFNDELENSWIPFLKGFKNDLVALGEAIKEAVKFIKGVNRAFTIPGWVPERGKNAWGSQANPDWLPDANKGMANKILQDIDNLSMPPYMGGTSGAPQAPPPVTGGHSSLNIGSKLASFAGSVFGGGSIGSTIASAGSTNFGGAVSHLASSIGGSSGSLVGGSSSGSNIHLASTAGPRTANVGGSNFGAGSFRYASSLGGSTSSIGGFAGGNSFASSVPVRNFASIGGASFGGGGSFGQAFGGSSTDVRGGNSVRLASWNVAANRAAPRASGGNLNIGGSSNNMSLAMFGRGKQGPLSADNWQSNRTASLTIRNVPGSNVFMAGAGMAV